MDKAALKSAWLFTVPNSQCLCFSQITLPSAKEVGPILTSVKPGSIHDCFGEGLIMSLPESWALPPPENHGEQCKGQDISLC